MAVKTDVAAAGAVGETGVSFGDNDDSMGDAIGSTGEAKGEIKGGDDGATVMTCGTVVAVVVVESIVVVFCNSVTALSFFNGDTTTTADPGEDGEITPKANSDSVTEGSSVALVGVITAGSTGGSVITGGETITATEGGGDTTTSSVGVKTDIIDEEAFAKKRESFSSIAASIADADAYVEVDVVPPPLRRSACLAERRRSPSSLVPKSSPTPLPRRRRWGERRGGGKACNA